MAISQNYGKSIMENTTDKFPTNYYFILYGRLSYIMVCNSRVTKAKIIIIDFNVAVTHAFN